MKNEAAGVMGWGDTLLIFFNTEIQIGLNENQTLHLKFSPLVFF